MAHLCNSSTRMAETGGLPGSQGQLALQSKTLSQNKSSGRLLGAGVLEHPRVIKPGSVSVLSD